MKALALLSVLITYTGSETPTPMVFPVATMEECKSMIQKLESEPPTSGEITFMDCSYIDKAV